MDSKVVSAAIKAEIWPALAEVGFQRTSSRTAWREHPDRVDVINLCSFNGARTPAPHITSYSFGVFAGCYFKYIPGDERVVDRTGAIRPEPYDCHARTSLERGYMDFMESRKIWRIDAAGKKIPKAIQDARRVILGQGQRWLAQFSSPRAVYDMLRAGNKVAREAFLAAGSGSPHDHYLQGYTALAAGLHAEARVNLLDAADSGCYAFYEDRLRRDAARAGQESSG